MHFGRYYFLFFMFMAIPILIIWYTFSVYAISYLFEWILIAIVIEVGLVLFYERKTIASKIFRARRWIYRNGRYVVTQKGFFSKAFKKEIEVYSTPSYKNCEQISMIVKKDLDDFLNALGSNIIYETLTHEGMAKYISRRKDFFIILQKERKRKHILDSEFYGLYNQCDKCDSFTKPEECRWSSKKERLMYEIAFSKKQDLFKK